MNWNWNTSHSTHRQPLAARRDAELKQKIMGNPSVLFLDLLEMRINCRLLLLEFKKFRLYNRNLIRCLFFRCNIFFNLLPHRVKLFAKYGLNWRACGFDYEIAQLLQFERNVHNLARWPGRDNGNLESSHCAKGQ